MFIDYCRNVFSVDRLLALLLGLRYRQVVTLKRTYVIVITLWVLSGVSTATWLWNPQITLWYGIIGIPLCITISIFSYTKIFFILRHHNTQIHSHVQKPNQTNQLNIARYKKAVSTAIWLQLTMVTSSLNPILYCWKIEEIRQAVKHTIRQMLCNLFSNSFRLTQ